MAAQGRNEGFHVLDEFVCEAVHASLVPRPAPGNQGRNEGMTVVEELIVELGPQAQEPDEAAKNRTSGRINGVRTANGTVVEEDEADRADEAKPAVDL